MDYYSYRNGKLFCEDVPVSEIASSVGTPAYVYSAATLLHHYRALAEAFSPLRATICFSIKTLSNLHILRLLAQAGAGFDVVSGGALARAQAAGGDMRRIVYAGVGKTDRELTEAINAGIGLFNVESEEEFENLSRLATRLQRTVRVALRLNPDVYDPKTHTYTTTGKKETKFGVDIERGERFFETYGRDKHAVLDGIHLHIGSPIYSPEPYVQAITKTLALIRSLAGKGLPVRVLDIGGGVRRRLRSRRQPDGGYLRRRHPAPAQGRRTGDHPRARATDRLQLRPAAFAGAVRQARRRPQVRDRRRGDDGPDPPGPVRLAALHVSRGPGRRRIGPAAPIGLRARDGRKGRRRRRRLRNL